MKNRVTYFNFAKHLILWFLVIYVMYSARGETNPGLFWKDISLPTIFILYVIFGMIIPFYFTFYILSDIFIEKKNRNIINFIILLISIIIYVTSSYLIIRSIFSVFFKQDLFQSRKAFGQSIYILLSNVIMCSSVASVIRVSYLYYSMTIKVADMEKEKIRFELDFLKSQIQPHFFFNVMNTIYFQIDSSNQSARNSIYKLSNIMRYILYESSSEFVDINQELSYISNYFQLQLQRQEFKANIKLNIKVEKNIKIRPHLIMPLIENAFKHKSNNHDSYKNLVNIIIKQNEQNDVIVHVINNYDKKNVYINNVSGIGLENLNKRLTLLYPNRKLLHIHPNIEKKIFKATLIIPYENEMHHH